MKSVLFSALLSVSFSALADDLQFFKGEGQRSSMDGAQKFGPSYASLVRRSVDLEAGLIHECIFQENDVYIVELKRTALAKVYSLNDSDKVARGLIIMETEEARAWSYDIDLDLNQEKAEITGGLSEGFGARIYPDGTMDIKKIWNRSVLIHEVYHSIGELEYLAAIATMVIPAHKKQLVEQQCR